MNKINKSAIIKGRELSFFNDTKFESYSILYPISEVNSCSYKVKASRQDGFILLLFEIDAKLMVYDSRDNAIFPYHANSMKTSKYSKMKTILNRVITFQDQALI